MLGAHLFTTQTAIITHCRNLLFILNIEQCSWLFWNKNILSLLEKQFWCNTITFNQGFNELHNKVDQYVYIMVGCPFLAYKVCTIYASWALWLIILIGSKYILIMYLSNQCKHKLYHITYMCCLFKEFRSPCDALLFDTNETMITWPYKH